MGATFSKKTDGQVSPSKDSNPLDQLSYQISKQNAKLAQGIQEMTGHKNADITKLGDEFEFYRAKSNSIGKTMEMLVKCVHDFRPSSLMEKIGFDKEANSFEHSVANTAADASENKQLDDHLKSLLFKISVTEFQLGQFSVKRTTEITSKVEIPLTNILNTTVKDSVTAQKATDLVRFHYDSARLRLKNPKVNEKIRESIQKEVDNLKKSLDQSVTDTIVKMKKVTETTELGSALLALIKLQEEYHKTCAESMAELLPQAEDLFLQHEKGLEIVPAFSSSIEKSLIAQTTSSAEPEPTANTNDVQMEQIRKASGKTETFDGKEILSSLGENMEEFSKDVLKELRMERLLQNSDAAQCVLNVEEMENGQFGVKKTSRLVPFGEFLKGFQADKINTSYLNTQYDDISNHGCDLSLLKQVLTRPLDKILSKRHLKFPSANGLILQQMTLWMGGNSQATSSGLHHDFHDNFYILLEGFKTFHVYKPSDFKYLYLNGNVRHLYDDSGLFVYGDEESSASLPFRSDGSYSKDALEWKLGKLEDLQDDPQSSYKQKQAAKKEFKRLYKEWELLPEESLTDSPVDPPSFSKIPPIVLRRPHTASQAGFPLLSKASPSVFHFYPGDIFYLPCGWFHEVVSTSNDVVVQTDDMESKTFRYHAALNYWFAPSDSEDESGKKIYKDDYWKETFGDQLDAELCQMEE